MSILQAIFLGALQGLAEFLPVSSSGHLALAAYFMELSDVPLLFDILLHLATLAAVVVVFRVRIIELCLTLGRLITRRSSTKDARNTSLILALIAGTMVTGVLGFALKDLVENLSPFWISCALVVTGLLLLLSGKIRQENASARVTIRQGLIVGLAQGIGVIPGISRSGSTISSSLFVGMDRATAGEFSFLLSIPAILAAFILELKSADTLYGTVSLPALIAGMLSAFVVGYLALRFLLALIRKGRLAWFALYLIPAGITLAVYFSRT